MIAITGLIGSGKSLVASVVRNAGFDVLDADTLAHKLYKENTELQKEIAKEFGNQAFDENRINRKYMANLVFNDKQKLELLESIIHPVLQKEIEKINPPFLEAAVLYKWPEFSKKMEKIWVVEATEDVRRERLLKKGLPENDIENRIQMQPKKLRFENGEFIIENNGTPEDCIAFTERLIKKL